MSYLQALGMVALWVWTLTMWIFVAAGAVSWRDNSFDRFEVVLFWGLLAVAIASTAWLVVLL